MSSNRSKLDHRPTPTTTGRRRLPGSSTNSSSILLRRDASDSPMRMNFQRRTSGRLGGEGVAATFLALRKPRPSNAGASGTVSRTYHDDIRPGPSEEQRKRAIELQIQLKQDLERQMADKEAEKIRRKQELAAIEQQEEARIQQYYARIDNSASFNNNENTVSPSHKTSMNMNKPEQSIDNNPTLLLPSTSTWQAAPVWALVEELKTEQEMLKNRIVQQADVIQQLQQEVQSALEEALVKRRTTLSRHSSGLGGKPAPKRGTIRNQTSSRHQGFPAHTNDRGGITNKRSLPSRTTSSRLPRISSSNDNAQQKRWRI